MGFTWSSAVQVMPTFTRHARYLMKLRPSTTRGRLLDICNELNGIQLPPGFSQRFRGACLTLPVREYQCTGPKFRTSLSKRFLNQDLKSITSLLGGKHPFKPVIMSSACYKVDENSCAYPDLSCAAEGLSLA